MAIEPTQTGKDLATAAEDGKEEEDDVIALICCRRKYASPFASYRSHAPNSDRAATAGLGMQRARALNKQTRRVVCCKHLRVLMKA